MKIFSARAVAFLAVFVAGILIGSAVVPIAYDMNKQTPVTLIKITNQTISEHSATVHVVALFPTSQKGIVGTATVEVLPGRGRMLLNANPFIEPDTQESASIAKTVAEDYTGMSLENNDIIVSFDLTFGNDSAQLVGGPSAGAALAVAMIAAMTNSSVRSGVAITGRILPNGTVDVISGILEKAQAAGEANMSLFIVPAGQTDVKYYEKVEEHEIADGFSVTRVSYMPRKLILSEHTKQWNMTSVEVSKISDAVKYAIEQK